MPINFDFSPLPFTLSAELSAAQAAIAADVNAANVASVNEPRPAVAVDELQRELEIRRRYIGYLDGVDAELVVATLAARNRVASITSTAIASLASSGYSVEDATAMAERQADVVEAKAALTRLEECHTVSARAVNAKAIENAEARIADLSRELSV